MIKEGQLQSLSIAIVTSFLISLIGSQPFGGHPLPVSPYFCFQFALQLVGTYSCLFLSD